MASNGSTKGDAALLAALVGGSTIEHAAALSGCSVRTAYRRMQDAAFRKQLDSLNADVLDRVVARLADSATLAVATLRYLARRGPPAVRLGAARAILEMGIRLRESVELEQRLAAVEARLEGGGNHET